MAIPLTQKQKNGLDPLTSGGAVAGTGDGAFTGAQTGTGFTNAQDLLAANKGKGQSMYDAIPGSSPQDETDYSSGIDELKNYDPTSGLKSSTAWGEASDTKESAGATDITKTWQTPTISTKYDGMSTADVDNKAAKIRGLQSKFSGLSDLNGNQDGASELRSQALAANIQKTQPLYAGNKGQGAFDSFLVESEAAPSIQTNSNRYKGLMSKFDGFDASVDGLKSKINDATGQVGDKIGAAEVMSTRTVTPEEKSMVEANTLQMPTGVINDAPVKPLVNNFMFTPEEKAENERLRKLAEGAVSAGGTRSSGTTVTSAQNQR